MGAGDTMQVMLKIWNYISSIGQNTAIPEPEHRRLRITNQLNFISLIFYLLFNTVFLILEIHLIQFDYYLTGLLFVAVFVLNLKQKYISARLLLCISLYWGLVNIIVLYGKTLEANLLLFPVMLVPFFIFDMTRKRLIFATFLLPFLFFIFGSLSGLFTLDNYTVSANNIEWVQRMIQLTSVIAFSIVIYFFVRSNQSSEQAMESKNTLLQQQIQTIFENSSDALLIIDNQNGKISDANQYSVELFDCASKDRLIGKQVSQLMKNKLSEVELQTYRERFIQDKSMSGEVEFETFNGATFWGDIKLKHIETKQLSYQLVRIADSTQRKLQEAKMQDSIREKEILIDEIHHRVKNNLAIVSSLLHLQSSKINDTHLLEIFEESRRRIHSIALIHEKLYHFESVEMIDFGVYLESLTTTIRDTFSSINSGVVIHCYLQEVHLKLHQAIPCALILNELISLCCKKSVQQGNTVEVSLTLSKLSEQIFIRIERKDEAFITFNNEHFDDTLELTLVNALVHQIKGNLVQVNEEGMLYELTFSV
ncbi:MAG TPA: histidine kinase dimerization/phosphoacceptor domain -containing protein [Bacteroidia bacterium]|nr:histidine kinase dimerization/phosphoacceptor domain -containing protein [Bacteroidia bacterium]